MKDGSKINPLTIIRKNLNICPDQCIDEKTDKLKFINDSKFREILLLDLSTANQSLLNSEWKAATIMAGSVIEALLLWKLKDNYSLDDKALQTAINTLKKKKIFHNIPPTDLNKWSFHQMVEIVGELNLIKPDTVSECRIAKNYRNLIHAGRAERLSQDCDRGTALSTIAAVEHVIRDLP